MVFDMRENLCENRRMKQGHQRRHNNDLLGTCWLKLTQKFSAMLTSLDKEAINYIIQSIKNDLEKTWYSTQLHAIYMKKGRTQILTGL